MGHRIIWRKEKLSYVQVLIFFGQDSNNTSNDNNNDNDNDNNNNNNNSTIWRTEVSEGPG